MKLKVFTADGSSHTEKDFNVPEFEGNKGLQVLKDLLVTYQANKRQGSAKTKTRSEVAGTGKKAYRQKGTGHARHGDRQSPIYVGGGTAHGPKARDWSKSFNKKAKRLAFARAIFDKAQAGRMNLIETFNQEAPKTKVFNELITRINPEARKVLICDQQFNDNTVLSARNIERVSMIEAASINAMDIVRNEQILISEKGFEQLLSRLGNDTSKEDDQ